MQRVKRIGKYFESLNYTLVIYYHKDMSIKDIYNKMIEKEEGLEEVEEETEDSDEASVVSNHGVSYLALNSKTRIGTILHEVVHIMTSMYEFVGAIHSETTDELYAYQAQHVFEFILKTLIEKFGVPSDNLLVF
jgi:hypothetical protein